MKFSVRSIGHQQQTILPRERFLLANHHRAERALRRHSKEGGKFYFEISIVKDEKNSADGKKTNKTDNNRLAILVGNIVVVVVGLKSFELALKSVEFSMGTFDFCGADECRSTAKLPSRSTRVK